MARVLGLDLGSFAVKGVLRGATELVFAEARRAPDADKRESLRAAVAEVLRQLPAADQVVVSLSGHTVATHSISLPFTDPKRIEATVPFEVEAQLPFDLSEVAFDYQPVLSPDPKKTELLVGVIRRDELTALLEDLAQAGVDPRIVTLPGVALGSLGQGLPPSEETVALLDIGHERTTLALVRPGGALEFARTVAGGGKDLSRVLAQEFAVSVPEANHWKEHQGALGEHAVGPDGERAAAAFVRGLQPILRELRTTLKAYSARARRSPSRIYLTGGTSELPGIDEQLSRDLGLPVEKLALPAELQTGAGAAAPRAAEAYALAVRGSLAGSRAPRFNLRRGELAFKGNFDYLRDKVGRLVAYAATVLFLLIAFGFVRDAVLAQKEHQVDAELCKVTQRVLGSCEKDYARALNMLSGEKSPASALPQITAVNVLAELTQRIPQDANVTLDQLVIDPSRVTLRGQTDNSKQIDRIADALKGYRCFKDVKEGKIERSRDGQHVVFHFDIQLGCNGEAQPNPEAG